MKASIPKKNRVRIALGKGVFVDVESDEALEVVQRKAEDIARKIVRKDVFSNEYIG
jgi:prefoldin subunit 5